MKLFKQVYIEGKLQTRKWQDQNGQDRYTTEVVANDMQMLGARGGDAGGRPQGGGSGFRNNPPAQKAPAQSAPDNSFDDDDIPFWTGLPIEKFQVARYRLLINRYRNPF